MNIEIKFRGYGYDGQWHFGNLIRRVAESPVQESTQEYETFYIQEQNLSGKEIEVFPDTVGWYIGLKDCKGREIYEGDIVTTSKDRFFAIEYREEEAAFKIIDYGTAPLVHDIQELTKKEINEQRIMVIGNIFDNP